MTLMCVEMFLGGRGPTLPIECFAEIRGEFRGEPPTRFPASLARHHIS